MRLESFWPPRHAYDRTVAEWYRRRHPDEPWLTRASIKLLADLLKSTDRVLEWGAGTSTPWLGARVGRLLSIEHDPTWFASVSDALRVAGLAESEVRLLTVEPVEDPRATPYVRVLDQFGDGELDVALVDGEHRALCATGVIPKLSSGGILVVDDAHQFLDHPSPSPHGRARRGPLGSEWASFAAAVVGWRLLWTSDGYSDTVLYFKP